MIAGTVEHRRAFRRARGQLPDSLEQNHTVAQKLGEQAVERMATG